MNSVPLNSFTNGVKEYTSITHEEVFLANEKNNPFARICCKTRILVPTLCDGTCLDCKSLRGSYYISEPIRLMGVDITESGGDNDYIPLTKEDAVKRVEERIARVQEVKTRIVAQRLQI